MAREITIYTMRLEQPKLNETLQSNSEIVLGKRYAKGRIYLNKVMDSGAVRAGSPYGQWKVSPETHTKI